MMSVRRNDPARRGSVVHLALVAGVVATLVVSAAPTPSDAARPVARSIASIGDSMTRAKDVCCSYGDHPANSWSTGNSSTDGLISHRERLARGNRTVVSWNLAASGAHMSAAPAQATV